MAQQLAVNSTEDWVAKRTAVRFLHISSMVAVKKLCFIVKVIHYRRGMRVMVH